MAEPRYLAPDLVRGLVNTTGNSCFFNAILQALAPLQPVHEYLAAICRLSVDLDPILASERALEATRRAREYIRVCEEADDTSLRAAPSAYSAGKPPADDTDDEWAGTACETAFRLLRMLCQLSLPCHSGDLSGHGGAISPSVALGSVSEAFDDRDQHDAHELLLTLLATLDDREHAAACLQAAQLGASAAARRAVVRAGDASLAAAAEALALAATVSASNGSVTGSSHLLECSSGGGSSVHGAAADASADAAPATPHRTGLGPASVDAAPATPHRTGLGLGPASVDAAPATPHRTGLGLGPASVDSTVLTATSTGARSPLTMLKLKLAHGIGIGSSASASASAASAASPSSRSLARSVALGRAAAASPRTALLRLEGSRYHGNSSGSSGSAGKGKGALGGSSTWASPAASALAAAAGGAGHASPAGFPLSSSLASSSSSSSASSSSAVWAALEEAASAAACLPLRGVTCTRIQCLACAQAGPTVPHKAWAHESFTCLSLTVTGTGMGAVFLTSLLANNFKREGISGYDCGRPGCSHAVRDRHTGRILEVNAERQSAIATLPPVLALHLKRQEFDGYGYGGYGGGGGRAVKDSRRVSFELTLDMGRYSYTAAAREAAQHRAEVAAAGGNASAAAARRIYATLAASAGDGTAASSAGAGADALGHTYDLMSVVQHIGGAAGGHYITYRRVPAEWADPAHASPQWVRCSDTAVVPVSVGEVLGAEAYLLFYVRRDVRMGQGTGMGTGTGSRRAGAAPAADLAPEAEGASLSATARRAAAHRLGSAVYAISDGCSIPHSLTAEGRSHVAALTLTMAAGGGWLTQLAQAAFSASSGGSASSSSRPSREMLTAASAAALLRVPAAAYGAQLLVAAAEVYVVASAASSASASGGKAALGSAASTYGGKAAVASLLPAMARTAACRLAFAAAVRFALLPAPVARRLLLADNTAVETSISRGKLTGGASAEAFDSSDAPAHADTDAQTVAALRAVLASQPLRPVWYPCE